MASFDLSPCLQQTGVLCLSLAMPLTAAASDDAMSSTPTALLFRTALEASLTSRMCVLAWFHADTFSKETFADSQHELALNCTSVTFPAQLSLSHPPGLQGMEVISSDQEGSPASCPCCLWNWSGLYLVSPCSGVQEDM